MQVHNLFVWSRVNVSAQVTNSMFNSKFSIFCLNPYIFCKIWTSVILLTFMYPCSYSKATVSPYYTFLNNYFWNDNSFIRPENWESFCFKVIRRSALRIPTVHDFCVISVHKWACAHTQWKKFPQAKLDREINVFLLNEHCDIYFSSCKYNSLHIILFNLEKIISYSGMQIMTVKITTIWKLYVHVILNGVIFWQISYYINPYAWHLIPAKFYSHHIF